MDVTTKCFIAAAIAGGLLFSISTANAQFVQQKKLVGAGAVGLAYQGISVAVSGDGKTAIVGGYGDNTNRGAAWVFVRNDTGWAQQGNKLVGSPAVGTGVQEGYTVAISSDGNTALLGAPGDSAISGAVWVFARKAGAWTQQGQKLFGTGAVGKAHQGISCALSADGKYALIGGYSDNAGIGAAWVFARNDSGIWVQQGKKLSGTGTVGSAQQGISVALSADGSTAILGGWYDNIQAGAAWVFTRTDTVWAQQGSKLSGTGAVGTTLQGNSVSISGDGSTALVGGYNDNASAGAAWVFTRTNGSWNQQGQKLVGTGATGPGRQGQSVALSSDGNTVVSSAVYDGGSGAAWVFTRSSSTDVSPAAVHAPSEFRLEQNYPNPFNPSTTISFSLPSRSFVSLTIYDVMGRAVATLASEEFSAGGYSRQWNAAGMPSGIYFYRLQAGSFTDIRRLILLR